MVTGSLDGTTPFQVTFSLPENPVPFSSVSDMFSVVPTDPIYSSGGTDTPLSGATIKFWDNSQGGLFDFLFLSNRLSFYGDQIFQGDPSNPTLLLGTFPVDPERSNYATDSGSGSILSGQVVAGAPEPISPFLVGCGMVGLLLLRRKLTA